MKQFKLKKIATALAITGATLLGPLLGQVHAAGLGKLTVQSGLGQPLRAEIDLTSVTRDEAGSLAARLASPDAYRQAGVEYNSSLLGVRMTVDRRPDGQYFIRLSSPQPVNEPIVDALVELNWATGRLVREYTFLLDPVDMRPAAPPVAPEAAPAPKSAPVPPQIESKPQAKPEPKPAAIATPVRPSEPPKSGGLSGAYEVKKGDTLGKIARQAQADGASLDQVMIALQRANQDAFVGGNINRLKSGVILNLPDKDAVAAVTPSDASRLVIAQSADWKAYQDKVAGGVQSSAPATKPEAPKQAAKGKITAKVEDKAPTAPGGDQLKLSKPDAAAAAGKAGAKPKATEEDRIAKEREIRDAKARQVELEKNVKDLQKLAEVKNQNLADLQKQAQAKGTQVAQAPAAPPAPAKAEPAKADAPKAAPAAPPTAPAAPPVAAKAPEPAKAAAPAPAAPAVPAKAPEPPKAAAPAPVPAPAAPATPPAAPAKAPEPAKADAPKGDAPKADVSKAPEPPKAAEPAKAPDTAKAPETAKAVEPGKAPEPAKSETPSGDAPKADASKADAPKADAPKVAAKVVPKAPPPPPKPEPSLVDEFLDNPAYLLGGGGVLAALGGYAAFAVRRKRKDAQTGFENSIVTGGDLKANSVFGNTGGQSVDTGNSSFQSDFAQSGSVGGGATDSDEVDPVAEADVYIAYGRDAQAEEILKEALQKDPNRQTVRLKLLEIYNQRGDANAFGATANELHSATGGQGEQWAKAAALGQQVDPSNPLYGAGAGAAVNAGGDGVSTVTLGAGVLAAAAVASSAAADADKTMTLPAFGGGVASAVIDANDPMTKTVALEAMQGQTPAGIDLDFDLGGDAPTAAAPDLALGNTFSKGAAAAAPSVDFDLGFGDPAPAVAAPAAAMDTDFAPSGTLIMDAPIAMEAIGNAAGDKTQELAPVQQEAAADAGMSVDFDFDLGSDAAPAAAPAAPSPALAAAPAASAGGVDFDFGSLSLELPGGSGNAAPDVPADDVATKLDLAKAYQEMGDKDGARELLKEVLAEGSAAQKGEAQALMAGLG